MVVRISSLTDGDRYLLLDMVGELSARFNIEIYAYVLMRNHYHLLLKTVDANLSKSMQWFGTKYTRLFHQNNHTGGGHLFQGRFKSIIVENDDYLLRLSCYIHRNPLRAGIVERLADYPWSSYRFYAYKRKSPEWLNTAMILNQLSAEDRNKAYRSIVQQYSDEKGSLWEDVKHGFIYGSSEFVADLKARFSSEKADVELPQHNSLLKELDAEQILEKVSKTLSLDFKVLRNAKRIAPDEKDRRDSLVYLLWRTGRFSNQEIGQLFGLSYSAISKIAGAVSRREEEERGQTLNSEYIYSLFKV